MLTEIEKRIVDRIANKIIDDCVSEHPAEKISCIGDRSIGITYITKAIQDLPKDDLLKAQSSRIDELSFHIKEDTIKWAVLRGIM